MSDTANFDEESSTEDFDEESSTEDAIDESPDPDEAADPTLSTDADGNIVSTTTGSDGESIVEHLDADGNVVSTELFSAEGDEVIEESE